jgi:hypothetical protein
MGMAVAPVSTHSVGAQGVSASASPSMAAPSASVNISQAGKSLVAANASQAATGNNGLQVNASISGLDSGQLGSSVSAQITVDISTEGASIGVDAQNLNELNRLDDLIAAFILALLMQEKK